MLDSPRVVVYCESASVGGSEIATAYLLGELDPRISVVVAGPHRDFIEWLASQRPATPCVQLPLLRTKADLRSWRRFRASLRPLAPAVLHAVLTGTTTCQWALLAAAGVPGIAPVAVEHLLPHPCSWASRELKRVVSRRLAGHIAVGDGVAREIEHAFGLPNRSIATIYNGVPDIALDTAEIPFDGSVVGALARFDHLKGIDVLLRAMLELGDASLVLVGAGDQDLELRALATDLGLAERVLFTGWTDRARAYLPTFDVVAVPSRSEAMGLTIIEAMLARRAVVATVVGSVGETVVDGVTGILVPPDDPHALAIAISRLLESAPTRASMGDAGRQRALSEFSVSRMARSYETLYSRIFTEASAGTRGRAKRGPTWR